MKDYRGPPLLPQGFGQNNQMVQSNDSMPAGPPSNQNPMGFQKAQAFKENERAIVPTYEEPLVNLMKPKPPVLSSGVRRQASAKSLAQGPQDQRLQGYDGGQVLKMAQVQ